MANIKIEKYRGYEIEFSSDKELFLSDVGNEGKESKTLSGARKQIDEYIKQNAIFEPVSGVLSRYSGDYSELILSGIRKDLRFTYMTGEKTEQFSEYDEQYFFVGADIPKDLQLEEQNLNKQIQELNQKYLLISAKIRDHIRKFPTLKDKKKEIIEKLGL